MKPRVAKVLLSFLGIILAIILLEVLWQYQIIALPAVVVRGMGRVQGMVTPRVRATVQLPVAWHRQQHSLSCEVAALKMVLNFHGVPVSENQLINRLPFDSTPRRADRWGDPFAGFVGNINGTMMGSGYGVYWPPIAALASQWIPAQVVRLSNPKEITRHLAAGRPIIAWGYYGRGLRYQWRTPQGDIVKAIDGEHARVITGFYGPAQAPKGFFLLDPIFGSLTWPTEKLMSNWSVFDYHGVVVYPKRS